MATNQEKNPSLEGNIVDDQEYTNRFAEVYAKVKTFKDRARETDKNDAELRESRLMQEVTGLGILDKQPD